jgi:hypothetical protein
LLCSRMFVFGGGGGDGGDGGDGGGGGGGGGGGVMDSSAVHRKQGIIS